MKYLKAVVISMIILVFISFTTADVYAFPSYKGHDDMLGKVLFPLYEHDLKEDSNAKKALDALELASYLAIDQFGENKGADKLEQLRDYGVKGLPKTVNDPGYFISGGGVNHRKPTHRGWDYEFYSGTLNDYKTWKVRRPIIENTVDKFFDFNGDEKQKDSFCAVIYYIHILGDRYDDCVNNGKYYEPAVLMELGGRNNDDNDIIHELIKHLGRLFKNQSSGNYNRIITKLETLNARLEPLVLSEKTKEKLKDTSSEEFREYCECAKEAANLFMDIEQCKEEQFSMLLKSEPFFNKVFYKHSY